MLLNEIFGMSKKEQFNRRGKSIQTVHDAVELFVKGRLTRKEAESAIRRVAADKAEYSDGMAELMFAG